MQQHLKDKIYHGAALINITSNGHASVMFSHILYYIQDSGKYAVFSCFLQFCNIIHVNYKMDFNMFSKVHVCKMCIQHNNILARNKGHKSISGILVCTSSCLYWKEEIKCLMSRFLHSAL